ncbi:hypothetical protein D3C79_825330 [compost metagenome]
MILLLGIPLHTFAAARIILPVHAEFIAVVDTRCAHKGKLEQRSQLELLLVAAGKG